MDRETMTVIPTIPLRSPPSAHHQKSSIDLSLELERELNAETESEPTAPTTILDPDILSSLVVQLRHTIAELTQTRDDLITSLAHSHAQEAELRDSLSLSLEQNATLAKELHDLKEKSRADQDTISLLRQKVEESRQGLMRLQSEQRRQATLQLDLSKPGATPKAAKRSSFVPGGPFTPLTGSGFVITPDRANHRRVSSVSDQSVEPPSPLNTPSFDLSQLSSTADFLDAVRQELRQTKQELEAMKAQLAEAVEAKEASESCAKALRDFIAEHKVGETVHAPPPLSVEVGGRKVSRWTGLRLWRSDTTSNTGTTTTSTTSDPVSPTTPESTPTSVAPLPLVKKLGEFFTRLEPSQHHQPVNGQQDTMLNGIEEWDASPSREPDKQTLSKAPESNNSLHFS